VAFPNEPLIVDHGYRTAIDELGSNVSVSDLIFGYHDFLEKSLDMPIDHLMCVLAKVKYPIKNLIELKSLLVH
jgi:hypothetical protein